jgi:hypothetical protein
MAGGLAARVAEGCPAKEAARRCEVEAAKAVVPSEAATNEAAALAVPGESAVAGADSVKCIPTTAADDCAGDGVAHPVSPALTRRAKLTTDRSSRRAVIGLLL